MNVLLTAKRDDVPTLVEALKSIRALILPPTTLPERSIGALEIPFNMVRVMAWPTDWPEEEAGTRLLELCMAGLEPEDVREPAPSADGLAFQARCTAVSVGIPIAPPRALVDRLLFELRGFGFKVHPSVLTCSLWRCLLVGSPHLREELVGNKEFMTTFADMGHEKGFEVLACLVDGDTAQRVFTACKDNFTAIRSAALIRALVSVGTLARPGPMLAFMTPTKLMQRAIRGMLATPIEARTCQVQLMIQCLRLAATLLSRYSETRVLARKEPALLPFLLHILRTASINSMVMTAAVSALMSLLVETKGDVFKPALVDLIRSDLCRVTTKALKSPGWAVGSICPTGLVPVVMASPKACMAVVHSVTLLLWLTSLLVCQWKSDGGSEDMSGCAIEEAQKLELAEAIMVCRFHTNLVEQGPRSSAMEAVFDLTYFLAEADSKVVNVLVANGFVGWVCSIVKDHPDLPNLSMYLRVVPSMIKAATDPEFLVGLFEACDMFKVLFRVIEANGPPRLLDEKPMRLKDEDNVGLCLYALGVMCRARPGVSLPVYMPTQVRKVVRVLRAQGREMDMEVASGIDVLYGVL